MKVLRHLFLLLTFVVAHGSKGEEPCQKAPVNDCVGGTCHWTVRCNSCRNGFYGTNCTLSCSTNCLGGTCRRFRGTCTDGCKDGWYGPRCSISCLLCPGRCNSQAGICVVGQTRSGSTTAQHRKLLFAATQECSAATRKRCKLGKCRVDINGDVCHFGCKPGRKGSDCGDTCPTNCTHCAKYGNRCTSCKSGFYGSLCNMTCSTCKTSCHQVSGGCILGCNPGYHGLKCEHKCNFNCGRHIQGQCLQPAGHCLHGCAKGFFGAFCNQTCTAQANCTGNTCMVICQKDLSDSNISTFQPENKTMPPCTGACWGLNCQTPCPRNCSICCKENGYCLACATGKCGAQCNGTCNNDPYTPSCLLNGTCQDSSNKTPTMTIFVAVAVTVLLMTAVIGFFTLACWVCNTKSSCFKRNEPDDIHRPNAARSTGRRLHNDSENYIHAVHQNNDLELFMRNGQDFSHTDGTLLAEHHYDSLLNTTSV